jgi:hypothetical protein
VKVCALSGIIQLIRCRKSPMTWFDHHHRSKKLASAAKSSLRQGDEAMARRLYTQAAQEAEQALAQVSREKQVTQGVIAMFAASLWRRAHRSDEAARVARLIRGAPELFPVTFGPLDGATAAGTQPKRG